MRMTSCISSKESPKSLNIHQKAPNPPHDRHHPFALRSSSSLRPTVIVFPSPYGHRLPFALRSSSSSSCTAAFCRCPLRNRSILLIQVILFVPSFSSSFFLSSIPFRNISQKNAINRAKQKYIHRMGPTNFARIRAKLQEKKNREEVSQAEMFIQTRQSRKGKEVDKDTQIVITKLQESIESPSCESAEQAFQSIFGKEKPGRVRCLGRTITPSMLKKNEEIVALKKQHSAEIGSMAKKVQGLQGLVRCLLKEINPGLDDQALDNIMENAISNENSAAPPSSTSTHFPSHDKGKLEDDEDQTYDNEEVE